MSRSLGLVGVMAWVWITGWSMRWAWPSASAALSCAPEDAVRGRDGVVQCGSQEAGDSLHSAQVLALDGKMDLNRATEEDLILIDGIGPSLAHALVTSKPRAGFGSWEQVDAVPGIGPSKLKSLKKHVHIR